MAFLGPSKLSLAQKIPFLLIKGFKLYFLEQTRSGVTSEHSQQVQVSHLHDEAR